MEVVRERDAELAPIGIVAGGAKKGNAGSTAVEMPHAVQGIGRGPGLFYPCAATL